MKQLRIDLDSGLEQIIAQINGIPDDKGSLAIELEVQIEKFHFAFSNPTPQFVHLFAHARKSIDPAVRNALK